jgi:hypothetical protein
VSERFEGPANRVCELAELLLQLPERRGQFAERLLVFARKRSLSY